MRRGSPRPAKERAPVARLFFTAAIVLLVSACTTGAPLDSLDPRGPISEDIDGLFKMTLYIATAIFILVQGAILVAAIAFRDRPGAKEPKQIHGNAKLEVVWTVIPVLILAAIAVPTVERIFKYTECSSDALNVDVIGHQWWFEYQYADYDITTANTLVFPVDTEVCLTMTSDDVLHNYWIPKLNGKRYLVPGQETLLLLEASEEDEYWGHCAEFCGLSHALMRARADAVSMDEFIAWTEAQEKPATRAPEGTLEAEGEALFLGAEGLTCTTCHNVEGINELDNSVGPDLTHFASRSAFAGATLEFGEPGEIERWLANPPGVKPGSFMDDLDLTQAQIDALAAWLRSLE